MIIQGSQAGKEADKSSPWCKARAKNPSKDRLSLISLLIPGPGSGGLRRATFGVVGKTGSQECDSEQGQGRGRVMIEPGFVHPEY